MLRMAIAVLLSVASFSPAFAQADAAASRWPDRPIRFIVPFPAGATTDVAARIVAQRLGERLGQPIVIENRVGASGNIGSDAVAKAAPDGYTIGLATATTHPIAASLSPNLPYDPVKDFTPISMIGTTPYALVIWPGLPIANMTEFIAYAKAKPGELAYSSIGTGSLAHLAAQLFSTMVGVELTNVPYRSATQAVTDLVAGRIQVQFGVVAASLAAVRSGTVRALAVTSAQRVDALPDVPTISELIPGYEASLWLAIVMPAGVPPSIAARLHQEVDAVLNEPDVRKGLITKVFIVEPSTPDELRERIARDMVKWRDLAVKAKIRAE